MKNWFWLILTIWILGLSGCSGKDKQKGETTDPSFIDIQEMDPKLVAIADETLSDISGFYRFQSKKIATDYSEDIADIYNDESLSLAYNQGNLGITQLPDTLPSNAIAVEQSRWVGSVREAKKSDQGFKVSFVNNSIKKIERIEKQSTYSIFNCSVGPYNEDADITIAYQMKASIQKQNPNTSPVEFNEIITGKVTATKVGLTDQLSSCTLSYGKEGKLTPHSINRVQLQTSDLIQKRWKLTTTHIEKDSDGKDKNVEESFWVNFEGNKDTEISRLDAKFQWINPEIPGYLDTLIHSFVKLNFVDTPSQQCVLKLDSFKKKVRFSGLLFFLKSEDGKINAEGRYFKIRGEKLPPKFEFSPSSGVTEEGTISMVEEAL